MIKVELQGIDAVRKSLSRLAVDIRGKAMSAAINKTADKARAEINRAIPEIYSVKTGEVRSAIDISKASSAKPRAEITVFGSPARKGRSLNLVHFLAAVQADGQAHKTRGAKANKKALAALGNQLGFLIKKGSGLKKISGAFVGNKGRTVFMRIGKARLPIKPVQVIGFGQMFNSRRINNRVLDKINRDLPIEVDRAVKLLLDRL
ncbi:MAG: phage tail protein [Propionivibrio sp.]|nr:phage tail protein [Propionivibrio sp.]